MLCVVRCFSFVGCCCWCFGLFVVVCCCWWLIGVNCRVLLFVCVCCCCLLFGHVCRCLFVVACLWLWVVMFDLSSVVACCDFLLSSVFISSCIVLVLLFWSVMLFVVWCVLLLFVGCLYCALLVVGCRGLSFVLCCCLRFVDCIIDVSGFVLSLVLCCALVIGCVLLLFVV